MKLDIKILGGNLSEMRPCCGRCCSKAILFKFGNPVHFLSIQLALVLGKKRTGLAKTNSIAWSVSIYSCDHLVLVTKISSRPFVFWSQSLLDTVPARPFLWYHPMYSKTNVNIVFPEKNALKNLAQKSQLERKNLNSNLPNYSGPSQ